MAIAQLALVVLLLLVEVCPEEPENDARKSQKYSDDQVAPHLLKLR
jgi:hypothetical protein